MKKYDIVRQAKILNIGASAIMCAAGLLVLLLPGMSVYHRELLIGILYLLIGGAKLFGYFSNDLYRLAFQFDLAIGIFVLLLGVIICIDPNRITKALQNIIGLYVMLDGLLKLQTAFDAYRFGIKKWGLILLTAVLMVLTGFVTVAIPESLPLADSAMMGLGLLISGMANCWITAYTVRIRVKKRETQG